MTSRDEPSAATGEPTELPTPAIGDSAWPWILLGLALFGVGVASWRPVPAGVWHDDGTADYEGIFEGTGHGFVDWVWESHARMSVHSHQITNVLCEIAGDRASRRRGLLGRSGMEGALVLAPCRWIHTIGMRFPIDVAFLDRDGTVLDVVTMPPGRVGRPRLGARMVVEAEAGEMERWGIEPGLRLEVRS